MGGGNTALEDALYLADIAQTVYLIHRRDTFRGEEATVTKLKQRDNVEFILNSTVTKLIAEKNLTGIEVSNKDGSTQTIEVNGLFISIGSVPSASIFDVEKDKGCNSRNRSNKIYFLKKSPCYGGFFCCSKT